MCTVTFLPIGTDSFILTSNRDELYSRSEVVFPQLSDDKKLLYPEDKQAHGTWVGTHKNGTTVCLLNGALKNHKRTPPYRLSRGQVVLDFFESESSQSFVKNYDLTNIEPFTLIIVRKKNDLSVEEFKWDGTKGVLREIPSNQAAIWSSVTLYDEFAIKEREQWFLNWQNSRPWNVQTIKEFHNSSDITKPETSIFMRRNLVGTVGITSIESKEGITTMSYDDLSELRKHRIALNDIQTEQTL